MSLNTRNDDKPVWSKICIGLFFLQKSIDKRANDPYNKIIDRANEPIRRKKIMKAEAYFKKNGTIYGVSGKYEFGEWKVKDAYSFSSIEEANEFLETEEGDFRERELVSKSELIKRCGKDIMDRIKKYTEYKEEVRMYALF